MKRNKMVARKLRAGRHGYSKQKKRPCSHCQQVTRDSRENAGRRKPTDPEPVPYAETHFAKVQERTRSKRGA